MQCPRCGNEHWFWEVNDKQGCAACGQEIIEDPVRNSRGMVFALDRPKPR